MYTHLFANIYYETCHKYYKVTYSSLYLNVTLFTENSNLMVAARDVIQQMEYQMHYYEKNGFHRQYKFISEATLAAKKSFKTFFKVADETCVCCQKELKENNPIKDRWETGYICEKCNREENIRYD